MASSGVIVIDGGALEGGGQILRNAAALSCLLGQPITVNNIRAGRSNPGLRPQHMTGLQLIAELCDGKLVGAKVSSTEITFHPGQVKSGTYRADTKTAGSVCLMLQLCLPCAAFSGGAVSISYVGGTDTDMAPPIDHYYRAALPCLLFGQGPTELSCRGGTNADMAPQVDYTTMVFKPMAEKFGMKFECDIKRRGYFPKGGGEVVTTSFPTKILSAAQLTERGDVTHIYGRAFVAGVLPPKVCHIMAQTAERTLRQRYPGLAIKIEAVKEPEQSAIGTGTGIIIVAETSTGCLLAGSALGKRGVQAETVGENAAKMLLTSLEHGGCVDEYLQDQLILLMALAKGKSRVLCGPISLHSETAIHVAKLLTQAQFKVEKVSETTNMIECEGIGFENKQL